MPRPIHSFHNFVGQKKVVSLIEKHAAGSRATGQAFPSTVITGYSGTGKSSLARAIADYLQVGFTKVMVTEALRTPSLYVKLTTLKHGDIMLLDEAHRLADDCQDLLLGATGDQRAIQKMDFSKRRGDAAIDEVVSIANFTLIVASDRPGKLSNALLGRIPLRIRLGAYSDAEMRAICDAVCRDERIAASSHARTVLACAARGIPREVANLIDLLKSFYPEQEPGQEITKGEVLAFLQEHGIDEHMLRPEERQVLRTLLGQDRPISARLLARVIGVDLRYLENHVEAPLLISRLVEITPTGRRLTAKGREIAATLLEEEG